MKISIISVFPELHEKFISTSLIARAQENNIISFNLVKLSDMTPPKKPIDEPTCGPGAGMIIKPEIIQKAIETCETEHGSGYKIFFSPQGKPLNQPLLEQCANILLNKSPLSTNLLPTFINPNENTGSLRTQKPKEINHIILICSRYEGMDSRVEQHYADAIISIGDYVLMGGDVAAQVFIEGLLRLFPDVVGRQESVEQESFSSHLLDFPTYGLPKEWQGKEIPEIILSGNHGAIEAWRTSEACKKTLLERFDWLRTTLPTADKEQSKKVIEQCKAQIPNHYVALMHTDIVLKGKKPGERRVGHSSVTSLDLHDTARSCATYGIKNMFMVSPLKDQQKIMNALLDFWKSDDGKKYNITRYQAVSRVVPIDSLEDTIQFIEKQEGKK